MPVWVKAAAALGPLLLGALVSLAWQNSHAMAVLTLNVEHLRVDLERTRASLEPGRTIMLRLETTTDNSIICANWSSGWLSAGRVNHKGD